MKQTKLKELYSELYNIAKPLRISNNHAPSEKLIENEILMIRHMQKNCDHRQKAKHDQEILRWKWGLSACKELRREINNIEAERTE